MLDWLVLISYFAIIVLTGVLFSRKKPKNSGEYFLGSHSMPAWAVAISIVATSLSAVTFIGVPESSYNGNLTYLATNIGMVLAAIVIAFVFIPAFYRTGSGSIYEVLGQRYGDPARQAASVTFLIGRVLASGARIYAGAIPASIVLFGLEKGTHPDRLMLSIAILTFVGIVYTLAGGIRSVIWSDVIQFSILIGAALVAIVLILGVINTPFTEVVAQLRTGNADGSSKLTLFDASFDLRAPFSLPACIIGFTLLGIGSYGTDQDLAQRMLTCKDARRGARSVIIGILLGIPSVTVFLTLGLLLWIVYKHPSVTSIPDAPAPTESVTVFLHYILTQIPPGVRGLMMAGLFAAGLSSLNSAINAMSAAFISDLYTPLLQSKRDGAASDKHLLFASRIAVIGMGLILGGFACVCIYWKNSSNDSLINFALGVMGFAYAGLIGVFFCALLTRRGSSVSVISALVSGLAWMLMTQQFVYDAIEWLHHPSIEYFYSIHFSWKLTIGVVISTLICLLGKPTNQSESIRQREAAPRAA